MQVQQWDEMKKVRKRSLLQTTHHSSVISLPPSPQFTEYRNGYTKDHEVIVTFWEVFDEFSEEVKKKFLSKCCGPQESFAGASLTKWSSS